MDEWVLITGASSGIGRELARVFAAHGFSLVLLARDEARLKELAAECERSPGVKARVLARDLAPPNAADEVFEALRDTPVGILVNNAGFGFYGYFAESDLRVQTDLMQVNMIALVQLTHRFLQRCRPAPRPGAQRGLGAAFLPGPTVNLYYASKAFVFSFSYALAEELEGTGSP
jgi:short-subunit dehydrogenase